MPDEKKMSFFQVDQMAKQFQSMRMEKAPDTSSMIQLNKVFVKQVLIPYLSDVYNSLLVQQKKHAQQSKDYLTP